MTQIVQRTSEIASAAAQDRFAHDVQYYLAQIPRQLPSRYLYDGLGSALFDATCWLPWYGLTRAEVRLLRQHARSILGNQAPHVVVELGSGSGEKLVVLLGAAAPAGPDQRVHLIDISSSALDRAGRTIASSAEVTVTTFLGTYEDGLAEFAERHRRGERALVLFLGSNIGNFDDPGREAFLRIVRRSLTRGDALLLGADLVKSARALLLAYDDPLGVTAAFNRNLLVRINRELEGDFDVAAFDHRALWNASESRIEMHLVSRRRQRVTIARARLEFELEKGESIWTESSYKYTPDQLATLLRNCGFTVRAQWLDAHDPFALTLAEVV